MAAVAGDARRRCGRHPPRRATIRPSLSHICCRNVAKSSQFGTNASHSPGRQPPRGRRRSATPPPDAAKVTRGIVKNRAYGRLPCHHTARTAPAPTTDAERRLILAARRGDATAQARVLAQYEPMMRADRAPPVPPGRRTRRPRPGGAPGPARRDAHAGTPTAASRSATSPGCAPPARPATPSAPPAPQAPPAHHGHAARRRRRQPQGRLHRRRHARSTTRPAPQRRQRVRTTGPAPAPTAATTTPWPRPSPASSSAT